MQTIFSDFSKRVEYIIDTYYEGNKTKFAQDNGLSRQYVNKWRQQDKGEKDGKPNPSMEILVNIISNTGVNPTWLITGKGEPENGIIDSLNSLEDRDVSLLNDLKNSDITPDEKIQVVSTELRMLLDLLED